MNIFAMLLGKQYNVLAYLPETVLVVDETGRICYANKSSFSLFETQKLKGKNINDYFILNSEHILNNKDEEIKQILKLVTEENNTKIVDVKVTDVSSRKKKRYILTVIDNTQDHSMLDELIAEKKAHKVLTHTKNMLLAKMSNYISSPLNSVVGFSQTMIDGLSGELNEKQRKYIEIINNNASEVLLFINKLIEMSKAESDLYTFEFQNFDIVSLMSVISNETAVKLQNRDIKFEVNTEKLTRQSCYCDRNILYGIITNLIDNALSLTETGSVNVNLSVPELELLDAYGFKQEGGVNPKNYILFEILCKGIDTAPYANEDVFDPYLQADKNSKKYLLQSLLLCSTKKYLEKLKGIISVKSAGSNTAVFTIIIPSDKQTAEA